MEEDLIQEMHEMDYTHWWFRARRRIILTLIESLVEPGCRPRILDIGCGTGAMLGELDELGEAVGFDTSGEALAFARTRTSAYLIRGEAPGDLADIDDRFDLILLLDMLEHADNDIAVLRASAGLLRGGGSLIATVPAYQWLYAPRDTYHHHRRRYSKGRLRESMTLCGLDVDLISYYNFLLFPMAAALRLCSKIKGGEPGPDLRRPPRAVNRMLEEIFASERFLLPRISLPWGLSLVAVGSIPADGGRR